MTRKIAVFATLFLLLAALLPSITSARQFNAIGARGNGMGGAGVAMIDDENGAQWNPANLSLPSATTYEQDYATSLGIQVGAQAQSTNNFYQNSKDLVDFYENNSGSGIFDGNYSGNQQQFYELLSIVRDLEGDNQGALINGTGGFNSRHTNWSFSVNNITDVASYTELDLTGGLALDNTAVQNALAEGNTSSVNGSPSGSYQDAASSCENSFNNGSWNPGDFGFTSTTKSGLANKVAEIAQNNNVSVSDTKKFCEAGNQVLDQSASAGTTDNDFDTEAQRIVFEGASINEAALSYALPAPVMNIGGPVYLGVTARFMQGDVAYVEDNPFNSSASDTTDEIFNQEEDVETSSDLGLDLGLTYDARENLGLKVGIVGKYLNSPEFDYPENVDATTSPGTAPETLTIDPQVRVGISGYPLDWMPVNVGSNWWQLSADYDVTKNETLMQDYKKQYLAVGNEFNLINSFWGNLSLRVGARDNLVEKSEGLLYTGGIGLQIVGVNIEVSGIHSDKTVKDENGDEIPTVAGGHFNLAFRF